MMNTVVNEWDTIVDHLWTPTKSREYTIWKHREIYGAMIEITNITFLRSRVKYNTILHWNQPIPFLLNVINPSCYYCLPWNVDNLASAGSSECWAYDKIIQRLFNHFLSQSSSSIGKIDCLKAVMYLQFFVRAGDWAKRVASLTEQTCHRNRK